ncbi:thiamine biosynthesis protein ThiC [Kitasatospora sp. NPDC101155]|uniref:thiamine biosynthesis protein ThiC n=1 Tax=Kitasatospora sp. NPDC101155 TaxID=3364097 RepID=UPI0038031E2D
MKISERIRDEHDGGTSRPKAGGGSTAVSSEFDADAEAGMQAMSEEFKAQGSRVYLPLAD